MTALPSPDVLIEHLREAGEVHVSMTAMEAFATIAQIQLALRHPANGGPSTALAAGVAQALARTLPAPAQAIVALGWNPAHDVEPDG